LILALISSLSVDEDGVAAGGGVTPAGGIVVPDGGADEEPVAGVGLSSNDCISIIFIFIIASPLLNGVKNVLIFVSVAGLAIFVIEDLILSYGSLY
jgi:hypothetical protein